jgi:hypothetical protein
MLKVQIKGDGFKFPKVKYKPERMSQRKGENQVEIEMLKSEQEQNNFSRERKPERMKPERMKPERMKPGDLKKEQNYKQRLFQKTMQKKNTQPKVQQKGLNLIKMKKMN